MFLCFVDVVFVMCDVDIFWFSVFYCFVIVVVYGVFELKFWCVFDFFDFEVICWIVDESFVLEVFDCCCVIGL